MIIHLHQPCPFNNRSTFSHDRGDVFRWSTDMGVLNVTTKDGRNYSFPLSSIRAMADITVDDSPERSPKKKGK